MRRWVSLGLSILVAGCAAGIPTGSLQGVVIENPTPKPSFVLTDMHGEEYDFQERTAGKLTLLYFGYTFCPDICPVHMSQIAEVIRQYPDLGRNIEVVFVTVDPERDTDEVLRSYLGRWGPRFIGLTGSPEELEAAQLAVGDTLAVKRGEGPNYAVDHISVVFAYASDGLHHAVYPFGTRQVVWANDLRILGAITGEDPS